jgi:hypothetical protein
LSWADPIDNLQMRVPAGRVVWSGVDPGYDRRPSHQSGEHSTCTKAPAYQARDTAPAVSRMFKGLRANRPKPTIKVDSRGRRWSCVLVTCLVTWILSLGYSKDSVANCMNCHQGIESIAVGEMAEQISRLALRHQDPGGCVVCHGGDPLTDDEEGAHRGAPSRLTAEGGPGDFYRDPGHARVAQRTCGQCHESYAERWLKSVKSSGVEAIERNQCAAAWENRSSRGSEASRYGLYAIADEDGPEPIEGTPEYKSVIKSLMASHPRLFLSRLGALPSHPVGWEEQSAAPSCTNCHGAVARVQPRSGCSGCHMAYGTYQGLDPTIDRTKPDTLTFHRIRGVAASRVVSSNGSEEILSGIPLETCFRCHFDPRLASTNETGDAHVHYGQEDVGSGINLFCQDCHTSIEMHGDGNLPASSAAQMEIRCEDCHGTTDLFPWELPLGFGDPHAPAGLSVVPRGTKENGSTQPEGVAAGDGLLLTSRGNPFGNVLRDGDQVLLYSVSGEVHEVTLLKSLVQERSWRSELSKQIKSAPAHHQDMSCNDCHADWLPTCLGCHDQ